jgi:hypothetical protein
MMEIDKITYNVYDIQEIVGCGRNAAYALVNEAREKKLFPVKQIGKKFYIPAQPFLDWLGTV